MVLWAWTYTWTLLNPNRKPEMNDYTLDYLVGLVKNLKPGQRLYAEIRWSEPL